MNYKIMQADHRIQKVVESNQKHGKRLARHVARLQELKKCHDKPEHLLAYSGAMNEYIQAFMISHNFQMNIDPNPNPDQMSYQQLIDLGQKIGKVSRGLQKDEIDKLEHYRVKRQRQKQSCPICCTQTEEGQIIIKLRCKHSFHEQCIVEWLKQENKCPMCKTYVLKEHQEK